MKKALSLLFALCLCLSLLAGCSTEQAGQEASSTVLTDNTLTGRHGVRLRSL